MQVCIGNNNPTHNLDVNGSLGINGKNNVNSCLNY